MAPKHTAEILTFGVVAALVFPQNVFALLSGISDETLRKERELELQIILGKRWSQRRDMEQRSLPKHTLARVSFVSN